jgi:hypothetical protein
VAVLIYPDCLLVMIFIRFPSGGIDNRAHKVADLFDAPIPLDGTAPTGMFR